MTSKPETDWGRKLRLTAEEYRKKREREEQARLLATIRSLEEDVATLKKRVAALEKKPGCPSFVWDLS